MLSDDNYLNNFLRKMKTYISNGYMPFIDVIFTFDDQKNNIDTQLISKIIDTYLLWNVKSDDVRVLAIFKNFFVKLNFSQTCLAKFY